MFDICVHFIIQKLKNKHTVLKNIQTEKAEEPLILTEREETKTRYFPPMIFVCSSIFVLKVSGLAVEDLKDSLGRVVEEFSN